MVEASDEQLERAFTAAATFLKDRCEREGWQWTSNYLREHVRAAFGYRFSNTRSPAILRMVKQRHPELRQWIETSTLFADKPRERTLFDTRRQR